MEFEYFSFKQNIKNIENYSELGSEIFILYVLKQV